MIVYCLLPATEITSNIIWFEDLGRGNLFVCLFVVVVVVVVLFVLILNFLWGSGGQVRGILYSGTLSRVVCV